MALFSVACVAEDSNLDHDQERSVYDALFHHQIPLYYAFYHPDDALHTAQCSQKMKYV